MKRIQENILRSEKPDGTPSLRIEPGASVALRSVIFPMPAAASGLDTQVLELFPEARHAGTHPSPPGEEDDGRLLTQTVQRILDVALTATLLILLLPVFLIIALLIRLDSPGPILFTQARVGKDGVEFPFFKFRSMIADAEAYRHQLEQKNERDGPVFKIKDDPRVTRIGRLLRKFSLDELPQLFNVLRGEMSLVGPRPALPKEVALYTDYQRQRLAITPGLTGLWQVSGRARLSFERSVELDLFYIQHQSLRLNCIILAKTIPAVLKGDGAY